jgi:polyisoprenoid-binding protein YceI
MNRTIWLAVPAALLAVHVHAQPAPAAKPAAPSAAVPAAAQPAAKPLAAPPAAAAPAAPKPATATAAAPVDKSVEWALDPAHSHIGFTAKHLGFSKVQGQFKKFSAPVFRADPKTGKLTALEATADTASVDTGIEKRDGHLRSDDFFNSAQFPLLKLKLKSIKWNGNKFTAKTDLTIRDVTKEVPFKGELLGVHPVNFGQGLHQRLAYEAAGTISRKEFGLKYAAVVEGLSVVSDDIAIDFSVEASYTPPALAAAPATPAAPTAAAPATKTGAVASAAPAPKPAAAAVPPAMAPATKPVATPAAPAKPATAPAK